MRFWMSNFQEVFSEAWWSAFAGEVSKPPFWRARIESFNFPQHNCPVTSGHVCYSSCIVGWRQSSTEPLSYGFCTQFYCTLLEDVVETAPWMDLLEFRPLQGRSHRSSRANSQLLWFDDVSYVPTLGFLLNGCTQCPKFWVTKVWTRHSFRMFWKLCRSEQFSKTSNDTSMPLTTFCHFTYLLCFKPEEQKKTYPDRPRQWTALTRYVLWTHVICLCSTVVCFFGISHATGFAVLSAYFDGMQLPGLGFCGVLVRLSLSTLLTDGLGTGPWYCTTSYLLL